MVLLPFRRGAPLVAVTLWLALIPGKAFSAPPENFALDYAAEETCPSAQAFAKEVERRLYRPGKVLLGQPGARLIVRIIASEKGFVSEALLLKKLGQWQRRQLDGTSCQDLALATAVVSAMMLEGRLPDEEPPPFRTSPPKSDTAKRRKTAPPPKPCPRPKACPPKETPQPPPPSAWSAGVDLLVGADTALAKELSPLGELGGQVGHRGKHFNASLRLALLGIVSPTLTDEQSSARFSLVALAGEACVGRPLSGPWQAQLGAGIESGTVTAKSETPLGNSSQRRSWWAARLNLRLLYALTEGAALTLGAGALVPITRDNYYALEPRNALLETPPLGMRAFFGGAVDIL